MTIEERIQDLRKRKGLSQEQVAEALGVSRQAVSKWESGQSLPEVEKLISMSALFEVPIAWLELKGQKSVLTVEWFYNAPGVFVLFTATYLVLCGIVLYFTVIRKTKTKQAGQ